MAEQVPTENEPKQPAPKADSKARRIGPAFAEPEDSVTDLSSEILKMMPRTAGDRVTCRRVTGNHYRCNRWTPQDIKPAGRAAIAGMGVTMLRVTESRFIRVTRTDTGLSISPALWS